MERERLGSGAIKFAARERDDGTANAGSERLDGAADGSMAQRTQAADGSMAQRTQAADGKMAQRTQAADGKMAQRTQAANGSMAQRTQAAKPHFPQRDCRTALFSALPAFSVHPVLPCFYHTLAAQIALTAAVSSACTRSNDCRTNENPSLKPKPLSLPFSSPPPADIKGRSGLLSTKSGRNFSHSAGYCRCLRENLPNFRKN